MVDLDAHKNPRSSPTMTAASVLPVYALHLSVVNGPLRPVFNFLCWRNQVIAPPSCSLNLHYVVTNNRFTLCRAIVGLIKQNNKFFVGWTSFLVNQASHHAKLGGRGVLVRSTDCLSRRRLSLSDNQSSFSFSSLTTISSSRFAAIAVDSLGVAARCQFQVLPSACTILSTI